MARAAIKSLDVIPLTSTQVLDLHHPDGIPEVSTPVIFVATPTINPMTVGVVFSQSLAGSVTGSDAPPDSYSLTNVPAGLSFNTSTAELSGTPTTAISYLMMLGAVDTGFPFSAPGAAVASVSPAVATDTIPPTVPAMNTIVVNSTTPYIDLAGDFPMDRRSASVTPSDVVKVDIYKSADGGAFSLLTTKTASAAQPNPILTGSAIGGATLATFLYSGGDITISNVVDGVVSDTSGVTVANDACNFFGGLITLPVGGRVGVTLPSYTSGYLYSLGGLMIRTSRTALCPCAMIWRRPDATGIGTPMLSRTAQGSLLTYTNDAVIGGETDVVMERLTGNQFRYEQYDAATGSIISVTTHTVVMPAAVEVGVYLTRETPGAAISATFKNFWVSTQPRWSYHDLAVVNSHQYRYKFIGKDSATSPNSSAESAILTGTIQSSPNPGGAIKGHWGAYVAVYPGAVSGITGFRSDLPGQLQQILNFIASPAIKNNPYIKGIQISTIWAGMEGDVAGDYKFAYVHTILDALRANGNKRLMHSFWPTGFWNFGSVYHLFPAYLVDTPSLGVENHGYYGNAGVTARTWQPATGDREIAMIAAFGAEFNSDPNYEMWVESETALQGRTSNPPSGPGPFPSTFTYTNAKLETEIRRRMTAQRAAFPNTACRLAANYFNGDINSLLQHAKNLKFCVGGPDVDRREAITANLSFCGQLGGQDLRSVIPWVSEFQQNEDPTTNSVDAMYDGSMNGWTSNNGTVVAGQKPQYWIWSDNPGGTGTPVWPGPLNKINSTQGKVGNGISSTPVDPSVIPVPSGYTGGVITS